jgi:acyl carrier protein
MDAVFERLTQVVQNVFALHHDEPIELTEQTTAEDVPGWDSLMHVTIIVQVERAFKVRFASAEIGGLKKLGDLAQLIRKRLAIAERAAAA